MNAEKVVNWLLTENGAAVRHLTLRWLFDEPGDAPEVRKAREEAHQESPIARILSAMEPEGYWVKPGPGYSPKYKSIVWALIALAQSGASVEEDPRIEKAVDYYLEHAQLEDGSFSGNAKNEDAMDCLVGNMCWSLKTLGCTDPRLEQAYKWMAVSQTELGYARVVPAISVKTGPCWSCRVNGAKPCAWAAVKSMMAFGQLSESERTPDIQEAIKLGAELLLSIDPTTADYPSGTNKVSPLWFKLVHPSFYSADLLQITEALVGCGYAKDERLNSLTNWLIGKRRPDGTWPLERSDRSRMWVSYGPTGKPNPWVTLRALRVLRRLED
jgi:hypothetical protein